MKKSGLGLLALAVLALLTYMFILWGVDMPSDDDVKKDFLKEVPDVTILSVHAGEGDSDNVYYHIKYKLKNSTIVRTEVWLYQRNLNTDSWYVSRKEGEKARLQEMNSKPSFYTLKAVEFQTSFFAEWGIQDGKSFEDRYDGMEFEIYDNDKKLGNIVVYQHWFKKNRKEYPEVGKTVKVKKFDFKINRVGVPSEDNYNIEYEDFKLLIIPSEKKPE